MKDVTPTPGSDRIYYKHCHGRRGCDLRFVYMLCICCSLLLARIKVIPSFVLHFDFFIRITLVMHNFLLQENELPLKRFLFSSGEASWLTIIYIKKYLKMYVCMHEEWLFQVQFLVFLLSLFGFCVSRIAGILVKTALSGRGGPVLEDFCCVNCY